MADNVIRREIVQIGWDVEKSPYSGVAKEADKFKSSASKATSGAEKGFKKANSAAKKFGKGLKSFDTAGLDKINSKLSKITSKLGKGMVTATKKAAKGLAVLGSAGAAGVFKLTDMASDLYETTNKVSVSFGESSKDVMDWSKTSIKNMGMAQQTALDMAAGYGDMGTSMGLTQKAAADMSKSLVQRAADLASFKNMELDEINVALNGIFTGETESLKRLGVVMTQTNLEAFAKSQGKVYKEMSESEKVTLRYNYVLEKTKNAQDDFKNTGGGFANQLRMAKEQVKQLGTTIGGFFMPTLTKGLKKINDFGVKLGGLFVDGKFNFNGFKDLLRTLGPVGTALKNVIDKVQSFVTNSEKMSAAKALFSSIKTAVGYAASAVGGLVSRVWDFVTSTGFLDGAKTVIDAIGKAFKWVGDNMDGVITTAKILGGAFLGVYAAVKTVSAGMTIYNGLVKIGAFLQKLKAAQEAFSTGKTLAQVAATKTATGAQIGFNAAMLASPITWIIVGIVALIAIIIVLVKNWDKVKAAAINCWDGIRSAFSSVATWFKTKVVQPIANFFSNLWNKLPGPVQGAIELITTPFRVAFNNIKEIWKGIIGFFKKLFSGDLKGAIACIKDTFLNVFKSTVKAVASPINKLIGGANWVLSKLGSDKKIAEWTPYAKGTNGHPGGNAIVNDGNGAELVQFPNGRAFIPRGRNVLLPNAPKGMKVLSAEQTARLMGKSGPTFNYKDGTGIIGKAKEMLSNLDIWDFFDNAKGLVDKVIDKFVSFSGISYAIDAGKAVISSAKGAMTDWVKGLFDKNGGKSLDSYNPSKGVSQWESTVIRALKMERQYSAANLKRTLYQMQTESGGNPRAINLWDSNAKKGTPSKGLMQVIDPTFKAYARKGFASDIYDPMSNILASIRYAKARYGTLEKAYQGHGYAGGIGLPHYTPDSILPVGGTSNSQTNNYSPAFNLTMNGTVDRTTKATIQRWVQEAIQDTLDSMARKSPRLTEV